MMVKLGCLVRIEVKPGKAEELEARLKAALPEIEGESGTTAWFAARLGPSSYVVFDVFPDEASRQAHLDAGRIRLQQVADLFAAPPSLTPTDIIVAKLP